MMSRKLRRAGFEASFVRPLRMKAYCIQGTQNMATRSEAPKMMDTATGNHFTKSYISPPMVTSMGKNVMLIARVALKMDEKNSFAEADAACHRLIPWSIFSM